MPLAPVKYDLNLGLNNAKSVSDLDMGELAQAQGIYYKRGSDECFMKAGRTAYAADALGYPGGLYFCEFTGSTNQLVARAGSSFYRSDFTALTGSWVTLDTTLDPTPQGLWGTYANDRYHFNDGVSDPWIFQLIVPSGATTESLLYRKSGLQPPTEQPQLQVNTSNGTQIVLTSSTVRLAGNRSFKNPALFVDGSLDTYASITIDDGSNNGRIAAEAFTGTGSGIRNDWIINVTYEVLQENSGKSTTRIDYSTNGGSTYTTTPYEVVNDAAGKHTVSIPLNASIDSANVGVRVWHTKVGNQGKSTCRAYDARLTTPGGAVTDNDAATGLIYWVTEKVDYLGIHSIAGPPSISTGPFTDAFNIQISLPSAPINPNTTHYEVWRTTDGGAFPVGTLVDTLAVGTAYCYDNGPLNQIASTLTYGAFTIAGIYYHRDITPPPATVMCTFQDAIVVAPIATPDKIRYSSRSYPESFPLINVINMASDRNDLIMALVPLSSQLGVFMRERCRRIDHLPQPSDPTFNVAPEDFAPDHGLESRNGWCYFTPLGADHTHIAYVARDGIRMTNLYQSSIITNNLDWAGTVDVTQLSTATLCNNAAASRLELYAYPTLAFQLANDLPPDARIALWIHYQPYEGYNPTALRVTMQAATTAAAVTIPFQGTDYVFLMAAGIRVGEGQVFVDEVGTTDAMLAIDTSGTIQRRIQIGRLYGTSPSRLTRTRLARLVLDSNPGTFPFTLTVTAGRDDRGTSWSRSSTFINIIGGALPRWINIAGQWYQVTLVADSAATTPPDVRNFSWNFEEIGEMV